MPQIPIAFRGTYSSLRTRKAGGCDVVRTRCAGKAGNAAQRYILQLNREEVGDLETS